MNLSTNPAVWRTAIGSIVAALVAAGVLSPALGDTVNAVVGALCIAAVAILPVVGAIISKSRTVPVAADTPATKYLVRGPDGVYVELNSRQVENPTYGSVPRTDDNAEGL